MRPQDLAKILRPFSVVPKTVRLEDGTLKGYHPNDFEDSFARYLPSDDKSSVTTSHEPSNGVLQAQPPADVTAPPQAGASHKCDGVTGGPSQEGVTRVEVLEL